jgi:hypothetical protein
MLVDMRARINPEAEYQRGSVWSVSQKRLLIDSILTGYDLPKIYFRKLPDGQSFLFDVIDGKQRLTAIWEFFDDVFRLSSNFVSSDLGSLQGKTWSELPPAAKDRLQFAKVSVSEIESASDDDVAELFLRLQKGEPLRAAEKRNAIQGPVRSFVADTLSRHRVFPLLGVKDNRFAWHEFASIALLLTISDGPASLKGADLSDLYGERGFDSQGETAVRTANVLELLAQVAESKPGAIKTRWAFVDLLVCLLRIEKLNFRPVDLLEAFLAFEDERVSAQARIAEIRANLSNPDLPEDPDELQSDVPDIRPDMLAYVQAFSREGATKENVTVRSEILFKRLQSRLDL